MYCSVCGAVNTEGAKFCGACGARISDERAITGDPQGGATTQLPDATGPTRTLAQAAPAPRPRTEVARGGDSLGSLAPTRGSGRGLKLALVLALDAALVIAGVVLMTRPRGGGAAVAEVGAGSAGSAGTGSAGTGSAGTGSGTGGVGSGGGGGGGAGTAITHGGGGGGGTGSSHPAAIDAGTGTVILVDAAGGGAIAIDAGVVAPAEDAAVAEPVIDAAEPAVPADDAAPAGEPDADLEEEVGAADIMGQFNHLLSTAGSKLDRCYQSATKGLPDDQPLSGQVDIVFTVLPTGKTGSVQMTRDTINSSTLSRCVISMIEGWTFSRHNVPNGIALSRTFTFGPGQ